MKEVERTKILKLLETCIIYPIADSRWVSHVHCVPKKGGITIVPNDKNEFIPRRIVIGYRIVEGDTDSRQHLWGQVPFRFGGGAESAQRVDRGSARGAILPSFGPHGCVKPYCCLFVYIGFLLRSNGRCQTEQESVTGVERAKLA